MLLLCLACAGFSQGPWDEPRIGSWVRSGPIQPDDVKVFDRADLILPANPPSNLKKAAELFRDDLHKLGVRVVGNSEGFGPPRFEVRIVPDPMQPESYRITTDRRGVLIVGADAHGAAFGLYELSERLGVDPLYLWTGILPKKRDHWAIRKVDHFQPSPTVRWRGFFHDDEDILPRPKRKDGVPDPNGTVPKQWYERYFETALRLRMNMVAPWVRTERHFEIQKMASDWGLAYTSHHYDILLSDPYHFNRGLAEKRGITPNWDWLANREGILRYWQAGVEDNRGIDAIYPIGLRGTNDYGYRFPEGWSEDQKIAAYNEVLALQANLVDNLLPPGTPRLMHFTMYTEMLPFYQTGKLHVPDGTIVVWPDDNDGNMRGLPAPDAAGKQGVYYHLAYLGGALTKQVHQMVPVERVDREFRKIVAANATDYILVNVSELREYVMGARFIADVMWSGDKAFQTPNSSDQYLHWWSREYFGTDAAVPAIQMYFQGMKKPAEIQVGGQKVIGAVESLDKKLRGEKFAPALAETLPMLLARAQHSEELRTALDVAKKYIKDAGRQRLFFENLELPAEIDRLNCAAAIKLVRAMSEPSRETTLALCKSALKDLDDLQSLLRKAERSPFQDWYRETWIAERNWALVQPRTVLKRLLDAN